LLFLPADDFIRKADTVRLVSGDDSQVCASMTITQGATVISVGPQYLDSSCDTQIEEELCPCGSFPYQGYVTSCKQFSSGMKGHPVVAGSRSFITSVPAGTQGFTLNVQSLSGVTFELYAFAGMRDTYDEECVLGKACTIDPPGRNLFNIQGMYERMRVFYSGIENRGWYSVIIPDVTEDVTFVLDPAQTGVVDIHISYGGVSPCENFQMQCEVCSASEWVCPEGQTATCDGGILPTCVDDELAPLMCIDCAETLTADLPTLPPTTTTTMESPTPLPSTTTTESPTPLPSTTTTDSPTPLPSTTTTESPTTLPSESPRCLGMTAFDSCMNGSAFFECEQAVAECGNEEHVLILESCPLQFQCQSQETTTQEPEICLRYEGSLPQESFFIDELPDANQVFGFDLINGLFVHENELYVRKQGKLRRTPGP